MATREEMLAAIEKAKGQAAPSAGPSREQMQAAIDKARGYTENDMGNRHSDDYVENLQHIPHNILNTMKHVPEIQWEAMKKLAHGVGTVAGYPGGLVRTMAALGPSDPNGNIVTWNDIKETLKGNAPSSDEYMKRTGVPEGSYDLPLIGKTSMRKLGGFGLDMATDPLSYFGGELGPAAHAIGDVVEAGGKKMYKSGLKRIDQEVAKYGKQPVSDVLMEHGVTGSAETINNEMDRLADVYLGDRNKILQKATAGGAEVDMNAAVKRAQDHVDQMRKIDNPEQREAVKALQARIDVYKARNAKNAEDVVRELPFSKEQKVLAPQAEMPAYQANGPIKHEYDIAGRTSVPEGSGGTEYYSPTKVGARDATREASDGVIHNPSDAVISLPQPMVEKNIVVPDKTTVFDQLERTPGPTPTQTSAWKTSNASNLNDSAWEKLARSPEGQGFDKALNGGIRDATTESVGRTLGPEAAEQLTEKNDKLGRLLTSQERAEIEANKEINKNAHTSVDGALLGSGNWGAYLAKKVSDVAKMTGPRTVGGKGLMDLGKTQAPDILGRRLYIDATKDQEDEQTPWLRMQGK